MVEGSDRLFQYAPTQEIYGAKRVGDALYCMPAFSNYVVKYTPEISDRAERLEKDYAEEENYSNPELEGKMEELVRTLDIKNEECLGMRYSELAKAYIITTDDGSYILDKDNNLVSESDRIVGEDKDGFIVASGDFTYYRVPYVSYDELVERICS